MQLKLTDRMAIYRFDIDLAAKTPSQHDDENIYESEQETIEPTSETLYHIDAVPQMLSQHLDGTDDLIAQRQQLSSQLSWTTSPHGSKITTSSVSNRIAHCATR